MVINCDIVMAREGGRGVEIYVLDLEYSRSERTLAWPDSPARTCLFHV